VRENRSAQGSIGSEEHHMNWKIATAALAALTATVSAQDNGLEEVEGTEAETYPWELELSLGLNGSRGSTDSDSLRAGFVGSQETNRNLFKLDLSYKYASEDSEKTENRFIGLARNDWKLGDDSPWSVFAEGEYEYNEFQNFESRVRGAGGLGYRIIGDENATLRARVGAGYTYSFGNVDDGFANGLLGLDFTTKVTDNQELVTSVTYYPNFDETDEYRLVSSAAYSISLTDEGNLSLRLGVENRRDTQADPESDTDYFVLLVYGF
jgi:putative salt-induced outer membrane protein YdiY